MAGTPKLTIGASQTDFEGNDLVNVSEIHSATGNLPVLGFLKMDDTDFLAWRNTANDNDNVLGFSNDELQIAFDAVIRYAFTDAHLNLTGRNLFDTGVALFGTSIAPAATTLAIWAEANGMRFNVAAGDSYEWLVNGVLEMSLNPNTVSLVGNDLQDVTMILMEEHQNSDLSTGRIYLGGEHRIAWDTSDDGDNHSIGFPSDVFTIQFNGTNVEYEFDQTQADFKGNDLIGLGTVNGHANAALPLNVVEIHTEDDWNNETLSGSEFRIMAPLTLTLGSEKTLPSGPWRIVANREVNTITYTGNSTLFGGTNVGNGQLRHLRLLNTGSGTLFGVTGSTSAHLFLFEVNIDGWADVGTLTNYALTGVNFCIISDNAANLKFVNCASNFASVSTWTNTVDSAEPLVSFSGISTQNITYANVAMIPVTTETAFSIDDITGLTARLTNVSGIAKDKMFTVGKLDQRDEQITAKNNANQQDSRAFANQFIGTAVTVAIAVAGGFTLVNDTTTGGTNIWTESAIERFTFDATTGRLTYIGVEDTNVTVTVSTTLDKVGGGAEQIGTVISKSGIAISESLAVSQSPDPSNVTSIANIDLANGDFIELAVVNQDSTDDIIINLNNFIVKE